MARPALDDAAWASRWRHRSTLEKAVLSLGLLAVAVASPGWVMSLVILAVCVVIALVWARVPARGYLIALLAPVSFVLIGAAAIAVHIGSAPDDAVWAWGPFSATADSLLRAATVSARSIAAFSAMLLLAATTPVSDVLAGLRRIRVPEVLIDIAGLMYRMLFALLSASSAIREAQAARLGYSSGLTARRSFGMLGGAVLMQAWNRARRLEAGLAGRGYTGSLRTLAAPHPVSIPFIAASVLVVVALAAASVLQVIVR